MGEAIVKVLAAAHVVPVISSARGARFLLDLKYTRELLHVTKVHLLLWMRRTGQKIRCESVVLPTYTLLAPLRAVATAYAYSVHWFRRGRVAQSNINGNGRADRALNRPTSAASRTVSATFSGTLPNSCIDHLWGK